MNVREDDRVSAVALVVESDAATSAQVEGADLAEGPVELSADSGDVEGPVGDGGSPVDRAERDGGGSAGDGE